MYNAPWGQGVLRQQQRRSPQQPRSPSSEVPAQHRFVVCAAPASKAACVRPGRPRRADRQPRPPGAGQGEGQDGGVSAQRAVSTSPAGSGGIMFPRSLLCRRAMRRSFRDGKLTSRRRLAQRCVHPVARHKVVTTGSLFLVGEQLLRIEDCTRESVPVP